MNITRVLSFGMCMLIGSAVQAQQGEASNQLVVYDPLFWKKDLRLSAFQCKKIRNIDIEYYEQLKTAFYNRTENQVQLKSTVVQCLAHRSDQIWDTFRPKQRKKWKKMFGEKEL